MARWTYDVSSALMDCKDYQVNDLLAVHIDRPPCDVQSNAPPSAKTLMSDLSSQ